MSYSFNDTQLVYTATSRCKCGAGLAYPRDQREAMKLRGWACSKVLRGETGPEDKGQHEIFDWAFFKIREESSINNQGAHSTRPPGTALRTIGMASCPKCGTQWESEPYDAAALGRHWRSGPCPTCGLDHGADGCTDSRRGPAIKWTSRDVVISVPRTAP